MILCTQKKKTATFYDEGNVKANFTTLTRVGETLAALLALPDAEVPKNEFVYLSSFYVSQVSLWVSIPPFSMPQSHKLYKWAFYELATPVISRNSQ